MNDRSSNRVADIEALLDAERDALLAGDFDMIDALKDRKGELLGGLVEHREGLSPEAYERLSEKAAHNQTLLTSAARGIAAVRLRLQEIRDARNGDASYTAEGQRRAPFRAPSLEKRA